MRYLSLLLGTLISSNSLATIVPYSQCKGSSKYHVVEFQQAGRDVIMKLDSRNFVRYSDLIHRTEGRLKLSGKELNTLKVENVDLTQLLSTKSLATELIVAGLLGRADTIGEEDLVYSMASDLLSKVECK